MSSGFPRNPTAVRIPGGSNFASAPDAPANRITGDLDLRCAVHPNNPHFTSQALIAKYNTTTNNRSYRFALNISQTLGEPELSISTDGLAGTVTTATANASPPWTANNNQLILRVTLDVNDGAGNRITTFYWATPTSGWQQLGTPIVTAGTVTIFPGTSDLFIGNVAGGLNPYNGDVGWAEVLNGIAGPVAARFDPSIMQADTLTTPKQFTSRSQEVWTIAGTDSWVLPTSAKMHAAA